MLFRNKPSWPSLTFSNTVTEIRSMILWWWPVYLPCRGLLGVGGGGFLKEAAFSDLLYSVLMSFAIKGLYGGGGKFYPGNYLDILKMSYLSVQHSVVIADGIVLTSAVCLLISYPFAYSDQIWWQVERFGNVADHDSFLINGLIRLNGWANIL